MMMTMSSMGAIEASVLDDIIRRLLAGGAAGKQVQLSEAEIRQLCVESRRIFLSQPNLLRLSAPIKICGQSSKSLLLSVLWCFWLSLVAKMILFSIWGLGSKMIWVTRWWWGNLGKVGNFYVFYEDWSVSEEKVGFFSRPKFVLLDLYLMSFNIF